MALSSNGVIPTLVGKITGVSDSDDPSTMMCWVKLNADLNAPGFIITLQDSVSNAIAMFVDTDGTSLYFVSFVTGTATAALASGSLTPDVWKHIAWTRNGTTAHVYVDGVDQGTVNPAVTFTPEYILTYNVADGSGPVDATLAYVRLWEAELSQSQVQAERLSAVPIVTADIIGDWSFASGSLNDQSGNGNHFSTFAGTPIAAADPPLGAGPRVMHHHRLRRA